MDVVFRGVVAYHIEGDCFENIVFDVEEVPIPFVVGDGATFAERCRQHGWPRDWNPHRESAQDFLARSGARVFDITCSYGLGGWVAATSMDQVVRERSHS